ncbi:MAG: hypothetical protein EOO28_04620 [Comamonadaceae bacterium]|nr:MAG: hypothetical protein EOO28_04620 [Comamonadaceae bacterium]
MPNRYYRPLHSAGTAPALTLRQALDNSPTLGRLTAQVEDSNARLKAVQSLIPEGLRPSVKAGPIDGDVWCLLVNGNAAAAKIRQLMPLIQSRLIGKGWKVTSIRLKILMRR